MERELLITGIGGQGVQLAAQVLARAATLEGREVMYLGLYGGMMRGGNTDSTVVVGDGPIEAPPVVPKAWSAIAETATAPLRVTVVHVRSMTNPPGVSSRADSLSVRYIGCTLTSTLSLWRPPPTMIPRSGDTSPKSRPHARVT